MVEKLIEEPLKDWDHFQELFSVCEGKILSSLALTGEFVVTAVISLSLSLSLIVLSCILQLKDKLGRQP